MGSRSDEAEEVPEVGVPVDACVLVPLVMLGIIFVSSLFLRLVHALFETGGRARLPALVGIPLRMLVSVPGAGVSALLLAGGRFRGKGAAAAARPAVGTQGACVLKPWFQADKYRPSRIAAT